MKLSASSMTLLSIFDSGALTFFASYMLSFSFYFARSWVCLERASGTLSVYPRVNSVIL